MNERTRMTYANGQYWEYEYDDLGQLVSDKKYWPDGTPVAGQQFEYTHDDIGNREQIKRGGDEEGGSLRTSTYNANMLNQYTSRTVPGVVDIMGIASGAGTVTVNNESVYRRGEYFHKALGLDNSAGAVYGDVYVEYAGGEAKSESGKVFVPQTPEGFMYDDDRNLIRDGRWNYEWNPENRLVRMRSLVGSPAPERRIEFEYDWRGRRIRKAVYDDRDDGEGTMLMERKYLYYGWNLIAELDGNNDVVRSYMWGLDMSGTLRQAGGVGGLLGVNDATQGFHFVAYDGNGNVMALVDADNGTISAEYEYGPFGEMIRATGQMSDNPISFSSKYHDTETGLVYYGYRYYSPSLGRWMSRDPIGEDGFQLLHEQRVDQVIKPTAEMAFVSLNGYLFVQNAPIGGVDILGLVQVDTGVERVEAPFPIPIESHYFLRVDTDSCGFWPKGGKKKLLSLLPFVWVKGHVYGKGGIYSGDPMDTGQKGKPVKLDPCKYNIKKFKSCIKAKCYDYDTGLYNLIFHNCWHWRELQIDKCEKASKK